MSPITKQIINYYYNSCGINLGIYGFFPSVPHLASNAFLYPLVELDIPLLAEVKDIVCDLFIKTIILKNQFYQTMFLKL